ncbi:MAG TPA: lysoplasmalogenase [Acidimicrobiales bacterium]|nr:lysoplasmalogenase [Acidimicrobiales bacterium]
MTTGAYLLVGLALVAAVVDWISVVDKDQQLEYLCKPLTVVVLIGAALALDPESDAMRTWFVAALVFSLAGDVFLMLKDRDLFVFGLGSFLMAHLAYVLGFLQDDLGVVQLVGGLVVAGAAVGLVGLRIVNAAQEKTPDLAVPVMAYMGVISLMLVVAVGTGDVVAVVGALLFYVSDALIGWTRFVRDFPWAPLAIIVTYHLAQVALVVSLV